MCYFAKRERYENHQEIFGNIIRSKFELSCIMSFIFISHYSIKLYIIIFLIFFFKYTYTLRATFTYLAFQLCVNPRFYNVPIFSCSWKIANLCRRIKFSLSRQFPLVTCQYIGMTAKTSEAIIFLLWRKKMMICPLAGGYLTARLVHTLTMRDISSNIHLHSPIYKVIIIE